MLGIYHTLGTEYLVPSTWYQVSGNRYLVPSTSDQVLGTKHLLLRTRYHALCTKYLVNLTHLMNGNRVSLAECSNEESFPDLLAPCEEVDLVGHYHISEDSNELQG